MSTATVIAVTQRARKAVADSCGFPPPDMVPGTDLREQAILALRDAVDELALEVLMLRAVAEPSKALGTRPEPRRTSSLELV